MIKPTDEMLRAILGRSVHRALEAVLPIVEREVRRQVADEIETALAADEADDDVTSGEAIWEQGGYRRGLAVAAEIAREVTP